MRRSATVLLFVAAVLPLGAQERDAQPPFTALAEAWGQSHATESKLFQAERDRLGKDFLAELGTFLGDDIDRHYWIAAFLTEDSYLHGRAARPALAWMIRQQAIELAIRKGGMDALRREYPLRIYQVHGAWDLHLQMLASIQKARAAELYRSYDLGACTPARSAAEYRLYEAIPLPDQRVIKKLTDSKTPLQDIIDKAKDATTVKVPLGRYTSERSVVVKGRTELDIVCEPGTEILVSDVNADVLRIVDSRKITLRGAHLRHVQPRKQYACHGSVLHTTDSSGIWVIDCDLNGCGAVGLYARKVDGLTVEHCAVRDNSFVAFYLDQCADVLIRRNIVVNNRSMLQSRQLKGLEMRDNRIRDNGGSWEQAERTPGRIWGKTPISERQQR